MSVEKSYWSGLLKFWVTFASLSVTVTGLFMYVNGLYATEWKDFVKAIYTFLMLLALTLSILDADDNAERSNP